MAVDSFYELLDLPAAKMHSIMIAGAKKAPNLIHFHKMSSNRFGLFCSFFIKVEHKKVTYLCTYGILYT